MKNKFFIIIIVLLSFSSCDDNSYPRPRGNVRLEYPEAKYQLLDDSRINFTFEKSEYSKVIFKNPDWIDLVYPKMRATVHLTNKKLGNDPDELIKEIQELTYKHTIKASGIFENPYSNEYRSTEGMLYELSGDAASNIQFYIKNKNNDILSGSLYFFVAPNSDSIAPAVSYIKKDIIVLMESVDWKN